MSGSQGLEVSDRMPGRGELHQLFRDQEQRCGNVEEWSQSHLSAVAAQDTGCYVRVDGTLVGAGLRDGPELLLAVASCDGLNRTRITTTLLRSSPGAQECWVPTNDPDLSAALATQGLRPLTVDLQMRLRLPTTAHKPLQRGFHLIGLAGPDDAALRCAA